MALQIFNSLSGKLEDFKSIDPKSVGMYNCGPTVYNHAHIGNLRAYVFADILKRTLILEGFNVDQVINITDVGHLVSDADSGEDKMEVGSKREGKSAYEIAEDYTRSFLEDLKRLNISTDKTQFPRATDHIEEQISLIKKLEDKGFTYRISDGIYFDTSKFPSYGKLGNINLEGLKEGARVEPNPEKKNMTDFSLWKFSPEGVKREMEWDSPWGVGFPGWHIECSAMSTKYLGQPFDIHTGGVDHIPTHHQAEIAQSESAEDKPLANYWLHSEHMTLEGEKMAKSTGNIYTLLDLADKGYDPLAYRYLLLQTHYRSKMDFSWEALEASQVAYKRLKNSYSALPGSGSVNEKYEKEFKQDLEKDLNTPQALATLWKMVKDESVSPEDKKATLDLFDTVLGLDLGTSEALDIPAEVSALVEEREMARASGDWHKADELREKVRGLGFSIEDKSSGPEVKGL